MPAARQYGPVLWGGVILVLPLLLYLGYVLERRPEINEHRKDSLEHAGRRLEQALEGVRGNISNLFGKDGDHEDSKFRGYVRWLAEQNVYLEVEDVPAGLVRPDRMVGKPYLRWNPPHVLLLYGEVAFRVNLERILEDIPSAEAFDSVLLVDDEGNVLCQHDTRAWARQGVVRVAKIDKLPVKDGEPVRLNDLLGESRLTEVDYGGLYYQMVTRPVRVPHYLLEGEASPKPDATGTPSTWIICAMVASSQAFDEAWIISSEVSTALALFVVVGLLPWPFLKLFLLRRRERLKCADVYLLLLATTAALMLSTILLLDVDVYWQEGESEELLKQLADDVQSNMILEWGKLRDELHELDDKLAAGPRGFCRNLHAAADGDEPCRAFVDDRTKFRNLKLAFWANSTGQELLKATVEERNTPLIDLTTREYFQAVRDRRQLWRLEEDEESRDRPFVVQTVRSLTTGAHETIVAIESRLTSDDDGVVMAGIADKVSWTQQLVLPEDFGFAVFDGQTGDIIYHSDRRRGVGENIYNELEGTPRLRAAVVSGTDTHFATDYLARPSELYVKPLDKVTGPDWHILTFREQGALGTANTEALVSAMGWAGVAVVLHLLLGLVLILIAGRTFRWLWPDPRRTRQYRLMSAVYAAVILVSAVCLIVFSGAHVRWTCLFAPLGVVLIVAVHHRFRAGSPGDAENHHLFWYITYAVSVWVLVGILPAIGFFKVSWRENIARLVSYEHARVEKELDTRRDHIRRAFREVEDGDEPQEALQAAVKCANLGMHCPDDETKAAEDDEVSCWVKVVQRYKPIYSNWSSRLRYQKPSVRIDDRGGLRFAPKWAFWTGLPVMVLLVFIWMRFVALRLFFGIILEQATEPAGASSRKRQSKKLPEEFQDKVEDRERADARAIAEMRYRGSRGHPFWRFWLARSQDEKLALVQLCQEGVVNPRQAAAVRGLLSARDSEGNRFLVRDPHLRCADRTFQAFVNRVQDPKTVEEWERKEPGIGWEQVWWVLPVMVGAVAVFLFVTQRQVFNASVGFITAFAALVPTLLRLAGALRGDSSAAD